MARLLHRGHFEKLATSLMKVLRREVEFVGSDFSVSDPKKACPPATAGRALPKNIKFPRVFNKNLVSSELFSRSFPSNHLFEKNVDFFRPSLIPHIKQLFLKNVYNLLSVVFINFPRLNAARLNLIR